MEKDTKIKWKYDSKNKHWFISESPAYANNGVCISNISYQNKEFKYKLHLDWTNYSPSFKRLSDAKLCASLLLIK